MQNKMNVSEILQKTLKAKYPKLSEQRTKILAREMVFAPENRLIQIDDSRKLYKEDLKFIVANKLEEAKSLEFNEIRAQSIEGLNSGTDSIEEYFSWLDDTTTILKHMNDGFVTQEDALEKQQFLKDTYQRENELMVCLSLYESCKSSHAQDKAKFIRYKLQKLREMRTAISFLTKEGTDVETTRSEFDATKPYYAYFKHLKEVPFGYDAPAEKKAELGIRHDLDEDLSDNFDRPAYLQNQLLDEMALEDEKSGQNYTFIKKDEENTDQNEENTGR